MSDTDIKRTETEYEVAKKIFQVLVNRKIVDGESGFDEYLENWDAVLELMDVVNKDKNKDLAENEALKAEIAGLRLSLVETLDAASAIARDDDLDWHHEALEKAAKTLRSK